MQLLKLWGLLAAFAINSPGNVAAKSHPSFYESPRSADAEPSRLTISPENKNIGNVNNNVQIESASDVKNIASGFVNDTSVTDQELIEVPQSNLAALVVKHDSLSSKKEVSSSARDVNEETQATLDPGQSSNASSRGLGLLLQSFILSSVTTTTARTTTTTAAPSLEEYSYAMKDKWPLLYVKECSGARQSPININRLQTQFTPALETSPLTFVNYDFVPILQVAVNNGHSLQVPHSGAVVPMVRGAGLSGNYSLAQYHFHWGSVSSRGSEHTIDSVRYPIEMHLVHFKTEYGSLEGSSSHKDGIVVLAVLFQLSTQANAVLHPIVRQIPGINAGQKITTGPFTAPSSLLPDRIGQFYKYNGSLTTPPCNEVVTFFVFKETQSISEAQLEQFRSLRDAHGEPLVDNFRNPQPLNGRKVQSSFPR